jgi:hypothetical protein
MTHGIHTRVSSPPRWVQGLCDHVGPRGFQSREAGTPQAKKSVLRQVGRRSFFLPSSQLYDRIHPDISSFRSPAWGSGRCSVYPETHRAGWRLLVPVPSRPDPSSAHCGP